MPTYKMNVVIEYDAPRTDSGDRQNAIISAIENIGLIGVRVTCDDDAGEVMRFKGDDRE